MKLWVARDRHYAGQVEDMVEFFSAEPLNAEGMFVPRNQHELLMRVPASNFSKLFERGVPRVGTCAEVEVVLRVGEPEPA